MPETIWENEIKQIRHAGGEVEKASPYPVEPSCKALHGMGALETMLARIAGIQGRLHPSLQKKGIVVLCADNGIVKEGVSQTGAEVTAVVAGNFLTGRPVSVKWQRWQVQTFCLTILEF